MMNSKSLLAAVAFVMLAGVPALAQQPSTTTKKKSDPVRDSIKALTKDIKDDKADRKAAKAAGDKDKVKADTKDIKHDEAARKALKSHLPPKHKKAP